MNYPFFWGRRPSRRLARPVRGRFETLDSRLMLSISGSASVVVDTDDTLTSSLEETEEKIDLELVKDVDKFSPVEGDTVTWTLTLTNSSDAAVPATGVKVQDRLPPGVTFVSAQPGGSSTFHAPTGIWTINQPLEPGESIQLDIQTFVEPGVADLLRFNVAEVIHANEEDVDSDPDNYINEVSHDDLLDLIAKREEDDEAFRFIIVQKLSSVAGFVYVDVNNNGIFDFDDVNNNGVFDPGIDTRIETPLLGVQIELYDEFDNLLETTFTDADGMYKFQLLEAGIYTIRQVQPEQFVNGITSATPEATGVISVGDNEFTVQLENCLCNRFFNFGERGLKSPSKRLYLASSVQHYWPHLNLTSGDLWHVWKSESSGFLEAVLVEHVPEGAAHVELFDVQMRRIPPSGDDLHWAIDAGQTYFLRLTGTKADFDLQLRQTGYLLWRKGALVVVEGSQADEYVHLQLGLDQHHLTVGQLKRTYNAATTTAFQIHLGEGNDRVDIVGSTADDLVRAAPQEARVYGPSYFVWTTGAEQQRFVASGGFDRIQMFDSPGNDSLYAHLTWAVMTGPGYLNRADGFERLEVFADHGFDTANFYDSPADDQFVAHPGYAYLSSGNYLNYARGFDRYNAFGGKGGSDKAQLYDSPGNDRYVDRGTYSYLTGDGFLSYVKGFEKIDVFASQGNDVAEFYDLDSRHTFYGRSDLGVVFGAGRGVRSVRNFDKVIARAAAGEEPAANVAALDYVFERVGTWRLI